LSLHIRAHYGEKISVESLAATAGMSRRSFECQFHSVLGCSSMTYLRRVQINAVCKDGHRKFNAHVIRDFIELCLQ
jgi:transcriptional regulator GlxA family with amidase domain